MSVHGILDDKRKITGIFWNNEDDSRFMVPTSADRIEAYGELGQHGPIPFLAVVRNEVIVARVPASQVMVCYD